MRRLRDVFARFGGALDWTMNHQICLMGRVILKPKLTIFLPCLVIAAGLTAVWVPSASALTVTNEADETVHVWIENWMYRLREGKTATFIPTEAPASIIFESRHMRISCQAGADAEVRVTNDKCFVDGAEAGESRFQL